MRNWKVLVCFTVFFSLISVFAFAAAGDLDSSFGTGGIVIENPSITGNVLGIDAVIQSTGKTVAVGEYFDNSGYQIALARFDSTGALDTTFGTAAGWTIINFGYSDIEAFAAAEQSDGNIVVAGPVYDGTRNQFFVARFTADGQPDTNFGNNGITLIDFGVSATATDLVVAAKDKIVVAGYVQGSLNENWGLARVDKKGKIDKSFGKQGLVVTDFYGFLDRANTVAVQPDDRIVAAGIAKTSISYGRMAVARYTDKGDLDSTFGSGGIVTTDFGTASEDFGNSIVLQTNGKIVVGGFAQPVGGAVFTFVRYNATGTIDLSHTEDYPGTEFDPAYGLGIATNGRIILGGRIVATGDESGAESAVSCYVGNTGILDANFGTAGWTVTDVGPDYENIQNLTLQSDNKIVTVGFSVQGDGRYYFALSRYIGCG